MNGYYFTFRSVTKAQRGQLALSAQGVPSELLRTPGPLAERGCGYCLRVSARWAPKAAQLLRDGGMERCFLRREAGYEEADCDLL